MRSLQPAPHNVGPLPVASMEYEPVIEKLKAHSLAGPGHKPFPIDGVRRDDHKFIAGPSLLE